MWIAMNNQAAAGNIENPIFSDPRPRIEPGFRTQVKPERRV